MRESVAVAKEAGKEKGFSPTKSGGSRIQRLRDEPERQIGSLRGVIGDIRRNGGKPSVEGIATQLNGMHSAERAPALLALQQTHGNRYVQRVVAGIQAKLVVGQPGDIYEQEADRVAEQVMRMPEPLVQRQPEEEEKKEKEEILQTKEVPSQVTEVTSNIESRIQSLKGGGQPLSEPTRAFFEPRFGQDFSQVRVHAGGNAAWLNRVLGARALTVGKDVFVGAGEYNPHTIEGKKLFAHELTHTIQQNATGPFIQRRLVVDPADAVPLPPGVVGPPVPLTIAVQGLMGDTCPEGNFQVNATTGVVTPSAASFCQWPGIPYRSNLLRADLSRTPVGCRCLCDVVNHARTTTVNFNAGGPVEQPDSMSGSTSGQGSNTTVNIDPRFQGQYRINGRWVDLPFSLLFSHELCGHALESMRGTHARPGPTPSGGTPPDERHAVDVERAIADEQGLPRRPEDYAGAARQRP